MKENDEAHNKDAAITFPSLQAEAGASADMMMGIVKNMSPMKPTNEGTKETMQNARKQREGGPKTLNTRL